MPNKDDLPLSYLNTQLRRDLWEHKAWREFKNGHCRQLALTYTHFNGFTMVYDEDGYCWIMEGMRYFRSLQFLETTVIKSGR